MTVLQVDDTDTSPYTYSIPVDESLSDMKLRVTSDYGSVSMVITDPAGNYARRTLRLYSKVHSANNIYTAVAVTQSVPPAAVAQTLQALQATSVDVDPNEPH